MNALVITGTLFSNKTIHKATWVSSDGKIKNQIDHVLINKKFRNSVIDTRVHRSADIGSDHYLVCAKVKLRLQKQPNKPSKIRTKFDIQKSKKEVFNAFTIELKNRYQVSEDETPSVLDEDEIERDYQVLEKAITEVADEVLGRPKKKRKPWISEQSWALVDQREELNKKILNTRSERVKKRLRMEYKEKNRVVKRSMRCDKRNGWITSQVKQKMLQGNNI